MSSISVNIDEYDIKVTCPFPHDEYGDHPDWVAPAWYLDHNVRYKGDVPMIELRDALRLIADTMADIMESGNK